MFLSQALRSARQLIRTNDITVPTKWGYITIRDGGSGGPNGTGPSTFEKASFVLVLAGILTLRGLKSDAPDAPDVPSFKRP